MLVDQNQPKTLSFAAYSYIQRDPFALFSVYLLSKQVQRIALNKTTYLMFDQRLTKTALKILRLLFQSNDTFLLQFRLSLVYRNALGLLRTSLCMNNIIMHVSCQVISSKMPYNKHTIQWKNLKRRVSSNFLFHKSQNIVE